MPKEEVPHCQSRVEERAPDVFFERETVFLPESLLAGILPVQPSVDEYRPLFIWAGPRFPDSISPQSGFVGSDLAWSSRRRRDCSSSSACLG
jgi:hypothetical protein